MRRLAGPRRGGAPARLRRAGRAGTGAALRPGPVRIDGADAVGLADQAHLTSRELIELLDLSTRPRGLPAGFGGRIAPVDGTIHQQDVRRPLGLVRTIPADRLRAALAFARTAPAIGEPWRTRGLRLVATDVGWSAGSGPEVRGPGEALLVAVAGRRGVVGGITGGGQPLLARRIAG